MTAYTPSSTVLCFENFKESALYFDRVIPLNMGVSRGVREIHDVVVGYPEGIPSVALSHLLDRVEGSNITFNHSERIMNCQSLWVDFAAAVKPFAQLFTKDIRDADDKERLRNEYQKLQYAYFSNATTLGGFSVRAAFRDYAKQLGFEKFCVAIPQMSEESGAQHDPSITLSELKLIDASQADWGQIVELRNDVGSHRKLVRLRLFIYDNYAKKSFSYIEDDLSQRIDEYERVVKKFGLKTTLSSMSMLLDAKALQASATAGLIAGLFGGPVVGVTTAAVVEIGKIVINVAERRHELKDWQAGHELAFIFDSKKRLT